MSPPRPNIDTVIELFKARTSLAVLEGAIEQRLVGVRPALRLLFFCACVFGAGMIAWGGSPWWSAFLYLAGAEFLSQIPVFPIRKLQNRARLVRALLESKEKEVGINAPVCAGN